MFTRSTLVLAFCAVGSAFNVLPLAPALRKSSSLSTARVSVGGASALRATGASDRHPRGDGLALNLFNKDMTIRSMNSKRGAGLSIIGNVLRSLPATGGYSSFGDLFYSLDKDGSGHFDHTKMKAAFRDMGVSVTDEDVDSIMQDLDVSNDGKVCFLEFQTGFELAAAKIMEEYVEEEQW
mmetsp:Transcript_9899/g.23575  ORF Transcript_9899/g.23575 Transcript_9899/m.23575 type:complete len:180 (-) Transcript_9899:267-806(-)|eukprot:2454320-Rhodomonas_salina.3